MVVEAQTENGAIARQNSGGPLNVTKMLAAVTAMKLFSLHQRRYYLARQSRDRTYLQQSENPRPSAFEPHLRLDVEKDEILKFASALRGRVCM